MMTVVFPTPGLPVNNILDGDGPEGRKSLALLDWLDGGRVTMWKHSYNGDIDITVDNCPE